MTLIERLEAAETGSRELDGDIAEMVQPDELQHCQAAHLNTLKRFSHWPARWGRSVPTHFDWDAPHYTTSIDAALTLVPEGWNGKVEFGVPVEDKQEAELWNYKFYPDGREVFGSGNTSALALCIAALKAREQTND